MKKIIILSCLLALMGCKTKQVEPQTPEKKAVVAEKPKEEISQQKKAYEIGKRILTTCNTSKFIPFTSSEATEKVITNSTHENIKKICERYNEKYGKFKDLKFVEMVPDKSENSSIYRFKALFDDENANKELRVTMNSENKASAISTKDWQDKFE